jgi:hypothetical protein
MKQIWPTYAYSPTTNVLTLTGLNIDRDQLLLVTAADRGRIMYNFADSSVTASAFTSGANTALTLVATTAGLTTTAALVIYFDDQATSSTVTGTVELGPTSLNALESITVTMGQVTVTGGLTDVQLRASAVTVGGTVTVGNSLTISSLSGTVTANVLAATSIDSQFGSLYGNNTDDPKQTAVPIGFNDINDDKFYNVSNQHPLPINGTVTVTIGSALPAGTNRIGVVTIGAGTVTIGAGTSQIGSVTASISNFPATQAVSLTTLPALVAGTAQIGIVTVGNTVTIAGTVTANPTGTQTIDGTVTAKMQGIFSGNYLDVAVNDQGLLAVVVDNQIGIAELPNIAGTVTIGSALPAGTNQIGSVTANTFAVQGTAVTTSNFTSTTASTVLANYNATREVLTIFNEGAGNLHICAGATCTTIAYQVRLSAGDYYEVPNHQTTITHSAVFATAGTARVTQVS